MKIGYIRTYIGNDSFDIQQSILRGYGCDKIVVENASANTDSHRQIFDSILRNLETGDTLVVASLNIVMKSISHLLDLIGRFDLKGITLIAIEDNLDTSTSYGKSFVESCMIIRTMETRLQAERTNLSHAYRRSSNRLGRKGITTKAQQKAQKAAELYRDSSRTVDEICDELEITRATFYRYLRHMGVVVAGR